MTDKEKIRALIERRRIAWLHGVSVEAKFKCEECKDILEFIDSLEVKEVQEPTASDRGMAEEIIVNLKQVENDYRIDLTKQMEWLRNIVKKGE